jgi:tRNA G10  N-methylase Trm11
MKLVPIHPFPARMAPEIAIEQLAKFASPKIVLDPMSGSGTVLRAASELGHSAIGLDLDPLAVLMARVWTTPFQIARLTRAAEELVRRAKTTRDVHLSWIDDCPETGEYVKFWFRQKQARPLRRLAWSLNGKTGVIADAMRIALSRIIITKERGASVARDASHSRPHRVFLDNEYDVYAGFLQSVKQLVAKLNPDRLKGSAVVHDGDSRNLAGLISESVDIVITSPPYLNAIDYLRGHRLSLVWLGCGVSDIRKLRSKSIGAEKSADTEVSERLLGALLRSCGDIEKLPIRQEGMVRRYAQDVHSFMQELARITKKDGRVLLVVGNSCLNGVSISNANINVAAAEIVGLQLTQRTERTLPNSNRYLPMPPSHLLGSLSGRMRTETLLSFCAA